MKLSSQQIISLLQQYAVASYYTSNHHGGKHYLALGADKELRFDKEFSSSLLDSFLFSFQNEYVFSFLSYDLKNSFFNVTSQNEDHLHFPLAYFFIPEVLLIEQYGEWEILKGEVSGLEIENEIEPVSFHHSISLQPRISKKIYLDKIKEVQRQIQLGNVYELNFCQEFYQENIEVDIYRIFEKLNTKAKTPFSGFFKIQDQFILSASPERFIKKVGTKIVSEPIKGTSKRGHNKEEDEMLKHNLEHDPKERAENVMIVDLVRNDLTKVAKNNSVVVEELCKIYSFETVHQMISRVVCETKDNTTFSDILNATFPMGSMTGAPKISAMKIAEELESFKRGAYSGSIGLIKPNQDFDFNVIIRSILYNKQSKYLSASFGGAITIDSIPEKEYQETLVKAKAIFEVLS